MTPARAAKPCGSSSLTRLSPQLSDAAGILIPGIWKRHWLCVLATGNSTDAGANSPSVRMPTQRKRRRGQGKTATGTPDGRLDKAEAYAAGLSGIGETDVRRVLTRRGCLLNHNGELRPTNAGILLFGKDPQRFVRGAQL